MSALEGLVPLTEVERVVADRCGQTARPECNNVAAPGGMSDEPAGQTENAADRVLDRLENVGPVAMDGLICPVHR